MTKATYILVGILFGVMIVCVTILIALDKEPDSLVQFLVATLVPTVAAIYAGNQSSKAKETAEQAVHNTNGRMGELIRLLAEKDVTIPNGYEDVVPDGNANGN